MNEDPRTIFVISDLHIGGERGDKKHPRGFRMCTQTHALCEFIKELPSLATKGSGIELVINGDFVDFLAEEHTGGHFFPFLDRPKDAEKAFRQIVKRDQALFDELKKFHLGGHQLTILLGNHDIELAHPLVTQALVEVLGGSSTRLTIQMDGQPYLVGDALIEHGNLYDGFNSISSEEIAALKNNPSNFLAPPGSRLVSEIMNPIKRDFPFVDLLKPEESAVIPVILVLVPFKKRLIGRIMKWKLEAKRREAHVRRQQLEMIPVSYRDSDLETKELSPEEALEEVLSEVLGGVEQTKKFLSLLEKDPQKKVLGTEEVAARTTGENLALLSLLASPNRIEALWQALQVVHRDLSFIVSQEDDVRYQQAAELKDKEIKWIVMGHTHLAKEHRDISPGRTYLNSGTWADLIPFPEFLLGLPKTEGKERLQEFLGALKKNKLGDWIAFRPHYVKMEFDGQRVTEASLHCYSKFSKEPVWRSRDQRST